LSIPLASGATATSNILQQVAQIGETVTSPFVSSLRPLAQSVTLGAGLLPKLVAKIEAGEFDDIVKLLPDLIGFTRSDDPGKAPSK